MERFGSTYDFWEATEYDIIAWIYFLRPLIINTDFHLRFNKLRKIDEGGFASVWLFVDKYTQTNYAVKSLSKQGASKSQNFIKQVMNELSVLRKIDNKSIVHFHEFHETQNSLYFVLEYLPGNTLEKTLLDPRDTPTIVCILQQIFNCLLVLEQKKIIHRDIKPSNFVWRLIDIPPIMNELVVIDFGLGCYDGEKNFGYEAGTAGYIAPEGFDKNNPNRKPLTSKVDVYGVGCMLFSY
jgi:serine/threonine protein kinase